MPSELVIQMQNSNGDFSCETYADFPSPKSAYVAICFTDNAVSGRLANQLKTALLNAIGNLGQLSPIDPPCHGNAVPFGNCRALAVADNTKLLLVVSDSNLNTFANNLVLQWNFDTLPVLPVGMPVILPPPFNHPQAAFWQNDITEVIPSIFGLLGIGQADKQIFISYRRTDTENLATQLFDRLTHAGFDVFLDRFSIDPAIDFQNRLYQELSDKAMVLVIESEHYLDSQWVQYEIDFAKKYRLGILAINIGGARATPSIDNEYRRLIPAGDLAGDGTLTPAALEHIYHEINMQHSVALYRMQNYMRENVITAFNTRGMLAAKDAKGFICVSTQAGVDYKIWATVRPAKVNDYHYADISRTAEEGIIIGPEFIEMNRNTLNMWLSGKSNVSFYQEGQILNMVNDIYP